MDLSIFPVTGHDDEDTNTTFASAAAFPDVRQCGVHRGSPGIFDQMAGTATESIKVEIAGEDAPQDEKPTPIAAAQVS